MVEQLERKSRVVLNKHRRSVHQAMPHPEETGVMFRGMQTISEDSPGVEGWEFDPETRNFVPRRKPINNEGPKLT